MYHLSGHSRRGFCQGFISRCQQVRAEISQRLTKTTYELDVMIETFEKGDTRVGIWPTWVHYPSSVDNIHEVKMNLRTFGRRSVDTGFPHPWSFIYVPLFILLSRLFHHGPQFIYRGPLKRHLHIDTLTIYHSHDNLPVKTNDSPYQVLLGC